MTSGTAGSMLASLSGRSPFEVAREPIAGVIPQGSLGNPRQQGESFSPLVPTDPTSVSHWPEQVINSSRNNHCQGEEEYGVALGQGYILTP